MPSKKPQKAKDFTDKARFFTLLDRAAKSAASIVRTGLLSYIEESYTDYCLKYGLSKI